MKRACLKRKTITASNNSNGNIRTNKQIHKKKKQKTKKQKQKQKHESWITKENNYTNTRKTGEIVREETWIWLRKVNLKSEIESHKILL